jgi:signal transduction histidine kinase
MVLGRSITKVRGLPLAQSDQPSRARVGRLIATCRVVLAAFAVVAVFVDPDMAGMTAKARLVVVPMMMYAFVLLVVAWNVHAPTRFFLGTVHGLDFALYTVMIYLTRGASSPFFVFFLFLVFCAMLRFGTKAVVWTGAAAAAAYVALAISQEAIRSDPGYLLLRVSSLGVVTTLIAYISAHQERSLRDMKQLAVWPADVSPASESMYEGLAHAMSLLRAKCAMVAWEAGEDPWLHLAMLDDTGFSTSKEGPEASIVAHELRAASFFVVMPGDDAVVVDDANVPRRWRGEVLGDVVSSRFTPRSILSAPLRGDVVRGRFFAFDAPEPTIDDLVLTRVAAGLIAARLAQTHFVDRLRSGAVAEERMRLARNLHDWLLQSLTGASLQLEVARRALGDGHPAADRLVKIQELLETDQRELRVFISQLRPARDGGATPNLHSRLASLADRFRRQWNVHVDVSMTPTVPIIPEGLAGEIYSLVSEAVANAAKHAMARQILARVQIDTEDVVMSIDDDGRGFPFLGVYTLEELNEQKRGPVTLKERVESLSGSLSLYSTAEGSRIEIRIPRQS